MTATITARELTTSHILVDGKGRVAFPRAIRTLNDHLIEVTLSGHAPVVMQASRTLRVKQA